MNGREIEARWVGVLAGEEADAEALAGQLSAIVRDSERARRLRADREVDRLLRVVAIDSDDGGAFTRAVLAALPREADSARFVSAVTLKLRDDERGAWRRRRVLAFTGAAALAGALVALIVADPSGGRLAQGPHGRDAGDGHARAVVEVKALAGGERVHTSAGEMRLVRTPDGALLKMLGQSRLTGVAPAFDGAAPRTELEVGRLSGTCGSAGSPVIKTPHALVRPLTDECQFELTAHADDTRVNVTSGRVRLEQLHGGSGVEIGPGEYGYHSFGDLYVRTTAVPGDEDAEVVWRLGPDAGTAPLLQAGRLDECPPGAKQRRCVRATWSGGGRDRALRAQIVDQEHGLAVHDRALLLAFDYWLGAWLGPRRVRLRVGLFSRAHGKLHEIEILDPQPTRWTHVVVPLTDLRRDGTPLQEGDLITVLRFTADALTEDVFYVDDVRMVRPLR